MHHLIALTLIQRGAIKQETEIEGFYKGVDLSGAPLARVCGTFIVKQAKRIKSDDPAKAIFFECVDVRDGSPRKIMCEDIIKIDGMEPDRAASVYGFTLDDGVIVELKKRGRKSKTESVDEDEDDDLEEAA